LLIIWLTPCNIASLFFLILCLLLIFHMYNQGRAREHRRIRHEERQNADHGKRNEFESVQWLNLVFENLWPRCLERFTSQEFFIPIAPWFINTYKPKLVKKAVLQHLNLGTQPPKFNSMRVLEQPNESNDHHLVLETLLQFITGENMSARLSVCFFKGIRGTFDISKFQIEGKMKLKVKFINGWPVIGHIQISFVDKPDVRLIARTNGLDLQFLPGANNWLVSFQITPLFVSWSKFVLLGLWRNCSNFADSSVCRLW
jgi:Ca2+-dependent lipid-binding protein